MPVGKPILRVGKIKREGRSTPQSVMGHLTRTRPTPNADPDRRKLNRWIIRPEGDDLQAAIEGVLDLAQIDPAKLRKDAVLANDIVMSVSPEWFRPDAPEAVGTWDENRLKVFAAEAEQMLRKTFGKRLVSAVLHLDESTPHIQAVVVPVLPKKNGQEGWRLSGKDMFNPTRLGVLQEQWEARMTPHGVGPRLKGSKARHTTLREYYGVLEATRQADPRPSLRVSEPPEKGRLEKGETYQRRVQEWRKEEQKRLRQELRPLAVQAAQGRLYDAERRTAAQLRGRVKIRTQELRKAAEELSLSKEQINLLRQTPINEVAAQLGWAEPLKPKENAIDLTMRAGELSYKEAVAWLAQRFDPAVAVTAVREKAVQDVNTLHRGPTVFTKAERAKVAVMAQQFDALRAPGYRVTIMAERDGEKVAQNLGKRRGEPEKFFTSDEVLNMIPELTAHNARGGNVLITPMDQAVHHVLIDDLRPEGLEQLKARGYAPSLVLETSPGNHQAVIKVPASAVPKQDVNEWFKDLNRDLGDQQITGLVHPLRLAGFMNMKPKHETADEGRRPFVRVVEATGQICRRALEVIRSYTARRSAPEPSPDAPELDLKKDRDAERPLGPTL